MKNCYSQICLSVLVFATSSIGLAGFNCWPGNDPCNPNEKPVATSYCNRDRGFVEGWWIQSDGSASKYGYNPDPYIYSIVHRGASIFYLDQYSNLGHFQKTIGPFKVLSKSQIQFQNRIYDSKLCPR